MPDGWMDWTQEHDQLDALATTRHVLGRSAFCRRRLFFSSFFATFPRPPPQKYPTSPLPPSPVGDAPVGTLRWRVLQLPDGAYTALIDRLYVLKQYRRRRVARTLLLNALVDVHEMCARAGAAPLQFVSVIVPQELRLLPVAELLKGLGFQRRAGHAADPTGFWAAAGAAPRASGDFVELALPVGEILPLLTRAQAAREGVKPRDPGT